MNASFDYDSSDIDRFMKYVDKLPNGCWFWLGGRSRGAGNKKWYGTFWLSPKTVDGKKIKGKSIRAHRFSCEAIGKKTFTEEGQNREHICAFSLCVNPDCLEIIHWRENQDRRLARARRAREGGGAMAACLSANMDNAAE